jgi:uncharacterized delta-60 repeat protein
MINLTDFKIASISKKVSSMNIQGGFNGAIMNILPIPSGKLLIAGWFTQYNGVSSSKIIRLNSDGSIDLTFVVGLGFNNDINWVALQSDGKLVCVGDFTSYNGVTVNRIVRLNIDGTIDSSFSIGTGITGQPNYVTIDSRGRILVCGGGMTIYNGVPISRLIRLNSNGTLDSTFSMGTGTISGVFGVAEQSDEKLVVIGNFTSYSGISRSRIVRLNSNGRVDIGFNPGTGFNSTAYGLSISNDKIVVTGLFNSYNGSTTPGIAMITSDGTIDPSFNSGTGFNSGCEWNSIIDNFIYCYFTSSTNYNGSSMSHIIKLNLDGSVVSSFSTGTGVQNTIFSIAKLSNTRLLIGGNFTAYNGIVRARLVKVDNSGTLIN